MAKYIELERALALIRPDEPEDEKAAVTIATAKKLVRSILYRIPAADVAPVVHGRWIADGDGYHWTYNCSICRGKMDTRLTNAITTAPTAARKWMETNK